MMATDQEQGHPWQQEQRQGNDAISSRRVARGSY
jgi:hypothetical protein